MSIPFIKTKNKNIWVLLIVLVLCLVKSLLWVKIVPIFQTPDEQAHFAQLQWYAEKKTLTINPQKNLSLEVATVEEILGTRRDAFGNNKYTYHPEYKNNSAIPNLPKEDRTIYVDHEAAGYPPVYYLLDLPFYYAGYEGNVEQRVMLARIFSIICHLGLVAVAYFVGKIVWEDRFKSAVLAVMVGFQPMVSFVAAGIHPDNLLNLFYSLVLLVCLLILKNGVKFKYLLILIFLIYLGLQTKIFMVFILPVVVFALLPNWIGILVMLAPVAAYIFRWPLPYMPIVTATSPLGNMNFVEYLKFRGPKVLFEMWPWYWGVFKWLGVTLPPLVMKIITRVAALSAMGLMVKFVKIEKFEKKAAIFFVISTFSYLLYLIFWDWRLMQSMGYSQGLQGRYLFPNIISQMALILIGATAINKLAKPLLLFLAGGMVVLNIIALGTVYWLYY